MRVPLCAEIQVKVVPNAKKSGCAGLMDDGISWKIKLAAPAVDGKANAALITYLAALCGTSKGSVSILSGEKSRLKRLRLDGISAGQVSAILSAAAG